MLININLTVMLKQIKERTTSKYLYKLKLKNLNTVRHLLRFQPYLVCTSGEWGKGLPEASTVSA